MRTVAVLVVFFFSFTAHGAIGPDLSGGTDVEFFTKLRFETAAKEGYASFWKLNPQRQAIVTAFRSGEFDQVLALADVWLHQLPIDADVHLMTAMSFKEKGDLSNMTRHLNVFYGLLGSITSGGDGLTPETAFKVVALDEEYSLVQEIGGTMKNQRLLGNVDRLEIERRNGQTLILHFDVSVHLKLMRAALGR